MFVDHRRDMLASAGAAAIPGVRDTFGPEEDHL